MLLALEEIFEDLEPLSPCVPCRMHGLCCFSRGPGFALGPWAILRMHFKAGFAVSAAILHGLREEKCGRESLVFDSQLGLMQN
jgi:hypothetical protein